MKDILCLRCNAKMHHIGTKKIQLGETGWILGDLPNLLAGALELDIYSCIRCGKTEFFMPENGSDIPGVKCPKCGSVHDFDYPKCPVCKYDYYAGE